MKIAPNRTPIPFTEMEYSNVKIMRIHDDNEYVYSIKIGECSFSKKSVDDYGLRNLEQRITRWYSELNIEAACANSYIKLVKKTLSIDSILDIQNNPSEYFFDVIIKSYTLQQLKRFIDQIKKPCLFSRLGVYPLWCMLKTYKYHIPGSNDVNLFAGMKIIRTANELNSFDYVLYPEIFISEYDYTYDTLTAHFPYKIIIPYGANDWFTNVEVMQSLVDCVVVTLLNLVPRNSQRQELRFAKKSTYDEMCQMIDLYKITKVLETD